MTAQAPQSSGNAPGFRAVRFNADWITRPLFGIGLALLVVFAVFGGGVYIAGFAALAGVAAAREWHRMVGEGVYGPAFFLSSAAIVAALMAQVIWPHTGIGWLVLAAGAGVVWLYAAARKMQPAWNALGPLYIGIAPMTLLLLRDSPHGAVVVIGLFLAIWATDTSALVIGNLVGGPRLWPALSPNKTWSGTAGAVIAAGLVEAAFVSLLGGHPVLGGLYGAGVAILAHAGDLFESWIKRVFHRKDSGGMIPGHGGVLDRIDSTLVAAPAVSILVLVLGVNPIFGVPS